MTTYNEEASYMKLVKLLLLFHFSHGDVFVSTVQNLLTSMSCVIPCFVVASLVLFKYFSYDSKLNFLKFVNSSLMFKLLSIILFWHKQF